MSIKTLIIKKIRTLETKIGGVVPDEYSFKNPKTDDLTLKEVRSLLKVLGYTLKDGEDVDVGGSKRGQTKDERTIIYEISKGGNKWYLREDTISVRVMKDFGRRVVHNTRKIFSPSKRNDPDSPTSGHFSNKTEFLLGFIESELNQLGLTNESNRFVKPFHDFPKKIQEVLSRFDPSTHINSHTLSPNWDLKLKIVKSPKEFLIVVGNQVMKTYKNIDEANKAFEMIKKRYPSGTIDPSDISELKRRLKE